MTPIKDKLVKFKQRRDPKKPGIEEWMHGQGNRLTYNEKNNQLILTSNARVSRYENGKLMDESSGEKITYNLTTSTAEIDGNKAKGVSGRVTTVIAPRSEHAQGNQQSNAVTLQPKRSVQQK